jgi:hypothetical protein
LYCRTPHTSSSLVSPVVAFVWLTISWSQRPLPRQCHRQVYSALGSSHFVVQYREVRPKDPALARRRWYDGLLFIHRRGRNSKLGTTRRADYRLVLLMDLLLRKQLRPDRIRISRRNRNSSTSSQDRWIRRGLYRLLWYLYQLCHSDSSLGAESWMELQDRYV